MPGAYDDPDYINLARGPGGYREALDGTKYMRCIHAAALIEQAIAYTRGFEDYYEAEDKLITLINELEGCCDVLRE